MTSKPPLTDYKKTVLLEESIKRYEELNLALSNLVFTLYNYDLSAEETYKLNEEIDTIMDQLEAVLSNIDQLKY